MSISDYESQIRERFQTTIPIIIREKASLTVGDILLWQYDENRKEIIVMPKPRSFTDELTGLGKEIWEDINAADHVRKERDSWDR